MKRTKILSRAAVFMTLASLVLPAAVCSLAAVRGDTVRANSHRPCATPPAALRRYASAVNAGGFDAQYALFARVEHGSAPAPIPLLPKESLLRLLTRLSPPFPRGLELGSRPLQALQGAAPGQAVQVFGFFVRVRHPGQPPPPPGRYSGSYLVALQSSPQGWKVRAYATYWMYFQRAYGAAAGRQFCRAYQREAERLGLLRRAGRATARIRGTADETD